jgi:uroporphyrinogen-III synthase
VNAPLAGCTVVVTREHRGELGRLLVAAGATVEHIPLIEIADVDEVHRVRLATAIADQPGWLIVTSAAGADRVSAVAENPTIRLAAVGTATAARLAEVAGRPVDLVPERQIAASLVEVFLGLAGAQEPQHVVIAQGDLADQRIAAELTAAGHTVDVHVAYRTLVRMPSEHERRLAVAADAVVFASGSSAQAWAGALGEDADRLLPSIVVAIGPTTRAVAEKSGLKITHEAAEHSLAGIIDELTGAWRNRAGQ